MVVGFTAFVLIAYNGIIDKPAPDDGRVRDQPRLRLLDRAARARSGSPATGFLRSLESGGRQKRKAPGTVLTPT